MLRRYQDRYEYLLVDEFQDTNTAQYELVRLLADKRRNIFAVGDEDQSIYSFRGADYRNVLRFREDFPDAQGDPARAELPLHADASSTPPTPSSSATSHRTPKTLRTDRGRGPAGHDPRGL